MEYPITPPDELVQQWVAQAWHEGTPVQVAASDLHIATAAARWGADQELKACCDTLQRHAHWDLAVFELMDDRRPKPPSLKKQALAALGYLQEDEPNYQSSFDVIRHALEALPND